MPLGKNALEFKRKYFSGKSNEINSNFDIHALRISVKTFFAKALSEVILPDDVSIEKQNIYVDSYKVCFTIYRPLALNKAMPVIIFHPGGGLAIDMSQEHQHVCVKLAKSSGAAVVCIQPGLAPEIKFPEIFNRCYQASKYVYLNANKLGIDNNYFYLSGYSLGGTVAALITNKSLSDPDLYISGQVIISGVLNIAQLPEDRDEDFMFDPLVHLQFIKMLLPEGQGVEILTSNPLYCPIPNGSVLQNLPVTRLIAGECDVFRRDSELACQRYSKAGVDVGLIILPGQIHNSLLLYPVMADGKDPAVVAGESFAELIKLK